MSNIKPAGYLNKLTGINDFEFERETSLDDFGDFPPAKEQPHD